jgi:lipoate-protein ligase A
MMGTVAKPGSKLEVVCWSAPTVGRNLALDDSRARAAWESGRRVLRFWWGGPPAVVIGSSERLDQVVHEAACARLGLEVLKRSTGGGSVLQTPGVLNYALVTPAPARLDLKGAFRLGADLICAILAAFGLNGTLEGTSDVAVGGRKISGNAQARRWKALLVHGTLLVDFDYDLAEKVLRHPAREPAYRRGRTHREFMVTLRSLGVKADRPAIERIAMDAARQVLRLGEADETSCMDIRFCGAGTGASAPSASPAVVIG